MKMADQHFVGVDNAGTSPRVGGVTAQEGVTWLGGLETGINIQGAGWYATHIPAAAAGGPGGGPAVGEHFTLDNSQPTSFEINNECTRNY